MPILVIFRPDKDAISTKLKPQGFTLLEMLVVLVIGGLLVSIAVPRFQAMLSSLDTAIQRDNVIASIEALGYQAYSEGRPIMLTDTPSLLSSAVQLPPGWKIKVDRPIEYSFNGVCRGGGLTITTPDGVVEGYQLDAPLCRLALTQK